MPHERANSPNNRMFGNEESRRQRGFHRSRTRRFTSQKRQRRQGCWLLFCDVREREEQASKGKKKRKKNHGQHPSPALPYSTPSRETTTHTTLLFKKPPHSETLYHSRPSPTNFFSPQPYYPPCHRNLSGTLKQYTLNLFFPHFPSSLVKSKRAEREGVGQDFSNFKADSCCH